MHNCFLGHLRNVFGPPSEDVFVLAEDLEQLRFGFGRELLPQGYHLLGDFFFQRDSLELSLWLGFGYPPCCGWVLMPFCFLFHRADVTHLHRGFHLHLPGEVLVPGDCDYLFWCGDLHA